MHTPHTPVPSQYQELGFTSSVMSQRVLETIEIIERSAKTSQHKDQLGQSSDQDAVADFEVLGTKVRTLTSTSLRQ